MQQIGPRPIHNGGNIALTKIRTVETAATGRSRRRAQRRTADALSSTSEVSIHGGFLSAEAKVLAAVRLALGRSPAVPAARGLSVFGEHAVGWVVLGAVGWSLEQRRRRKWATGAVGVLAAHGAAVAVKRLVRRARPQFDHIPPLVTTPSGLSFPSAHMASTAAAAYGFGPLMGPRVMAAAVGCMGVSRVLLGVHWPTDVVAGAVLGRGVAAAVRQVVNGGMTR